MKANRSRIMERTGEVKEELWKKVRQHLDKAVRDPETSEEDLQNLLAVHSAVVFEYKALLEEKARQTKQLLASLKERGVIGHSGRGDL